MTESLLKESSVAITCHAPWHMTAPVAAPSAILDHGVKDSLGVLRTLTPSLALHLAHAHAVTSPWVPSMAPWRLMYALTRMWEGLF